MRSTLLTAILGSLGIVVIGAAPLACQGGGVGEPCTPEDEYDPTTAGFKMSQEYIESRSFQCATRICLVNHFQGRTSCPLGQPEPTPCAGPDDTSCGEGSKCVEMAGFSETEKRYFCHIPGNCQDPTLSDAENAGRDCCVPGTDTPVGVPVCGQCGRESKRNAEQAVYCSCRCGVADGQEPDPNFNFCTCPQGFECKDIRLDLQLGDPQLAGKYCIKEGTAFDADPLACGEVRGHFDSQVCQGTAPL